MTQEYKIISDGIEQSISIATEGDQFVVSLGDVVHRFSVLLNKNPVYSFLVDDHHVLEAEVNFHQDHCSLNVGHVPYQVEIFDPRRRLASQAGPAGTGSGSAVVEAPMPGKIVEIKVKTGDSVQKDQAVIVVEAMKMQNELASPMDGIVKEIKVSVGDTVESGKPLMLIEKNKMKPPNFR